jgi:hypothetical protein
MSRFWAKEIDHLGSTKAINTGIILSIVDGHEKRSFMCFEKGSLIQYQSSNW